MKHINSTYEKIIKEKSKRRHEKMMFRKGNIKDWSDSEEDEQEMDS